MYLSDQTFLGKCSCIVCREIKSKKGIHTHYLIQHTEAGRQRHQETRIKAGLAGGKATQKKFQEMYDANPRFCEHCSSLIPQGRASGKFCSRSCAASFNNGRRSLESRKQQAAAVSKTLKEWNSKNKKISTICKVSFCEICKNTIQNKHQKTCSVVCCRLLASRSMSARLKDPNFRKKYGRQNRSYLEKSFSQWLESNHILYEDEIQFKNHELNKYYYADFVFRDIKLIIELDGTQHRKTVEQDRIRDEYIQRVYGYTVFRVTHKEYQAKSKYSLICGLLGIPC